MRAAHIESERDNLLGLEPSFSTNPRDKRMPHLLGVKECFRTQRLNQFHRRFHHLPLRSTIRRMLRDMLRPQAKDYFPIMMLP